MTFRLLGLPEELRLAIEEAGGSPTEEARVVYEAAVNEAVAQVEQTVTESLREVQSIIGPHGSISRLQTGGIRIANGEGIGVYLDGVFKTNIQPNGTLAIGSDISQPETTTEIFFVEDTVYNNEEFLAGDFLIGDNSESTSNVKFDASEGQLQFRYGTTVKAYMDTDGSLKAGAGIVTLDEGGAAILLPSGAASDINSYKFVDDSGNALFGLYGYISGSAVTADIQTSHQGAISQSSITIHTPKAGIQLSDTASRITINSKSNNVNTFINWDSGTAIVVNGGTGETQIDYGLEINSTFGDYDTIINGDTKELIWANAGLDGVGIGGDAESGYILKAHGKVNLTTGNTYDINGSPHTHTGLVTNGDTHDHNGGDGNNISAETLTFDGASTLLDASTSAHGFAPKATAPAAGELNVLGIANGETVISCKDLFNTTNPAATGTASSGTSTQAARSDHVHAAPTYSTLIGGNGASQTVTASSTNQLALYASGFIPVGANAPISKGGTLKNLYVRIAGTQPASGSLVFTLMINNVASSITCTQAAGAGAATISDISNTETVSAGDLIYVKVTNNATAASAPVGVFMMELETTTT